MKIVFYGLFFREAFKPWYYSKLMIHTNKLKPYRIREFPEFMNPFAAIFDKQSGLTWIKAIICRRGVMIGMNTGSHTVPREQKMLFKLGK